MQLIAAKAALAALTQQMSGSELDTTSEQPTSSRGLGRSYQLKQPICPNNHCNTTTNK